MVGSHSNLAEGQRDRWGDSSAIDNFGFENFRLTTFNEWVAGASFD
jgi:hypothetical protein